MQQMSMYYYEDGNTIRTTEYDLPSREELRREREERERLRQIRANRHAYKKQVHKRRADRIATVQLALSLVIACGFLGVYVALQNETTTRLDNIAALEATLNEVNVDNSAAESRIATNASLNDVKNYAMNNLGMVYASSAQIVYYSIEGSDYMNQYSDIP